MNVRDARGYTPLSQAACKNKLELVKFLLANNHATIDQITDVKDLQSCLVAALGVAATSSIPSAPPPAYSSLAGTSSGSQGGSFSTTLSAPVPKDSNEEEEQMRIALAASRDLVASSEDSTRMERKADATDTAKPSVADSSSQLAQVQAGNECIICFEQPVQTCFIPCGHSCACVECAQQFTEQCPVCRGRVQQVIRTYTVTS